MRRRAGAGGPFYSNLVVLSRCEFVGVKLAKKGLWPRFLEPENAERSLGEGEQRPQCCWSLRKGFVSLTNVPLGGPNASTVVI